jgi:hypothetical protein
MAFWMVFLVALVALTALVMYVLRQQSIDRERIESELHDTRTPTLEYSVPTGQDPVTILAALERAGYTAGVDSHGAHQVVMVKCADGPERDRSKVRSIIEATHVGPEDVAMRTVVRFRDEE